MPESTDALGRGGDPSGSPGLIAALEREFLAARSLLEAQHAVEGALRAASSGEELLRLVRIQEAEARALARAAGARQAAHAPHPDLAAWLAQARPEEARTVRSLGEKLRAAQSEIRRMAGRSGYLARRSLEWSQAQMESLIQWLVREQVLYEGTGAHRAGGEVPSFMDRSV